MNLVFFVIGLVTGVLGCMIFYHVKKNCGDVTKRGFFDRSILTKDQSVETITESEELQGKDSSVKSDKTSDVLSNKGDLFPISKMNIEGAGKITLALYADDSDFVKQLVKVCAQYTDIDIEKVDMLDVEKERLPSCIVVAVKEVDVDTFSLIRRVRSQRDYCRIPLVCIVDDISVDKGMIGAAIDVDFFITRDDLDELPGICRFSKSLYDKGFRHTVAYFDDTMQLVQNDFDFIRSVSGYILSEMSSKELSVVSLSEQFGVSRVHLYNRLRHSTGRTPIEYIRLMRLRKAVVEILHDEDESDLAAISVTVGFNGVKHFSKCFRDEYGMSLAAFQLFKKTNGIVRTQWW